MGVDLRSKNGDEIRSILDACNSDIRELARQHPEVIDQFEMQMKMDQSQYARLPKFVCIPTNAGLINTTIRYSDFCRFLQVWKQNPSLIDSKLVENMIKPSQIPLVHDSRSAEKEWGEVPSNQIQKR